MNKLKNYFFQNKPKIKNENELKELFIYICPLQNQKQTENYYYEFHLKKKLYFICYENDLNLNLKLKIRGIINIPTERIILLYKGTILNDNEAIPFEAFEVEPSEHSDDDIFRPRIFLHVEPEEEEEEEKKNNQSDSGIKSKESEIEEVQENNLLAHEIDIQKEAHQKENSERFVIPERSFNLIKNLEKINCQRYATILLQEGFGDEGSFSFLTEDILRSSPLFIPLVPRKRILALADATKRRIFQDYKNDKENITTMIETNLLQTNQLKTKKLEGSDETYLTKAEINRAWNEKKKKKLKKLKSGGGTEDNNDNNDNDSDDSDNDERTNYSHYSKKNLPDHIQSFINQVKESSQRDEFNLSLNPSILIDTPKNQQLFISPYQLPYDCSSTTNNLTEFNEINQSNINSNQQNDYLPSSNSSIYSKLSQNSSLTNSQDNTNDILFNQNDTKKIYFNISSNIQDPQHSSQYFCCYKHYIQCSEYHSNKYTMLKQSISSVILTQCNKYTDISTPLTTHSNPTTHIIYLTSYQIISIINHLFKLYNFNNLINNQHIINYILKQCLFTTTEMNDYIIYSNEIIRENPICDVPLRGYSIHTFINVFTDYLLGLELKRLLNQNQNDDNDNN